MVKMISGRKNLSAAIASCVELKRSLLWGVALFVVILLARMFLSPLYSNLRALWKSVFEAGSLGFLVYPGVELLLTLIAAYVLGRVLLVVKEHVGQFVKRPQGIPVLYKRDDGFFPGLARGTLKMGGEFPHTYLVKVLASIRGVPDVVHFPPERVWVVTMPFEDFMIFYGSGGLASPEECGAISWSEWQKRDAAAGLSDQTAENSIAGDGAEKPKATMKKRPRRRLSPGSTTHGPT